MKIMFCGHKEVKDRKKVERWLYEVCRNNIERGANLFYLGGYGEYDSLSAVVLRELKKEYSQIRLILVLPYLNGNISVEGYDETVYPPLEAVPKRFAISRRNEWMVKECDVIIAYVQHGWGGAAKTLEYARRQNRQIILYE